MSGGIAPRLLRSQVDNTAAWALDGETDGGPWSWRAALRDADALEATWNEPEGRLAYLTLMLAAHFATVATFVPTDVDTRIRHHAWHELHGRDALASAIDALDATDAWDARIVSARTVTVGELGPLSGHDGEWLAVRAGALGRALQTRADDLADRLVARIDAELERESQAFAQAERTRNGELTTLRVATVIAHNLGDLSRVVEAWPAKGSRAKELTERYVRLGHEEGTRYDGTFARAGALNKAMMAHENHRFLPLRRPRALRRGRELLLPMGPFFDAWGETLGRSRLLDADARGEVLGALLEGHESDPAQLGYLRAIAGLHRTSPGGIDALAKSVPARLRKLIAGGAVRDALRVDEARFDARMVNRYRGVRG